jgi:hypothetical protein
MNALSIATTRPEKMASPLLNRLVKFAIAASIVSSTTCSSL